MRYAVTFLLTAVVVVVVSGRVSATTWFPKEVKCPVCGTDNTFAEIGSYGGYVYNWPSKTEYVFWPYIDPKVLYSCKQCRLTLFMEDFGRLTEKEVADLKPKVAEITFEGDCDQYDKIPMVTKLDAAEKLYALLNKDDEFWCHFYRVKGYHLAEADKEEEAKTARKKALEFAEKLLKDPKRESLKKEDLVVKAVMSHWVGERDAAIAAFKESIPLKYKKEAVFDLKAAQEEWGDEKMTAEDIAEEKADFEEELAEHNKEMNDYLKKFAKEYLETIAALTETPPAPPTATPKNP